MLSGPAEALVKLLRGEGAEGKGTITSSTGQLTTMRNGIKYFAVEVKLGGIEYGISAFDEEAAELYRVAKSSTMQQGKEARLIPLVTV